MPRMVLSVVGLALLAVVVMGATTPNTIVNPIIPKLALVRFLQGTDAAGTYKTVFAAGADGARCKALWTTNNDTTATHVLTISIQRSAVDYVVAGTYTTSTTTGLTPASLMTPTIWPGLPTDSDGNPYFELQSGDVLRAQFATALTASTVIYVAAMCWDFS